MVTELERRTVNNLMEKTIRRFPACFGSSPGANFMKVSRWWKARQEIMALECTLKTSISRVVMSRKFGVRVTRHNVKALAGRGRKRAPWTSVL